MLDVLKECFEITVGTDVESALVDIEQADFVACDFDSAGGRRHPFGGCLAFAPKIVMPKRIVRFVDRERKAASSFNHSLAYLELAPHGITCLRVHVTPALQVTIDRYVA